MPGDSPGLAGEALELDLRSVGPEDWLPHLSGIDAVWELGAEPGRTTRTISLPRPWSPAHTAEPIRPEAPTTSTLVIRPHNLSGRAAIRTRPTSDAKTTAARKMFLLT